jgi:Tol biopolymer transport system component
VQDKAGAVLGHIETQGRGTSFSWSPGGQRLAHSYLLPDGQGTISKGIAVTDAGAKADANGKLAATQVVNDPVISYFWSPDGKKLAYTTFNDTGKMLVWKVYDFDSQKATQLAEWYPSEDTIQLLEYFDQYALGNSVWSPDSKALVFAGFTKEDVDALTQSGTQDADPMIYALPVDGPQAGKAVPVGVGKLAFWSK